MKLSDIKGETALDALADLIEPAAEIMTDEQFVKCIRNNNRVKAVKIVLKNHKQAIITIMAVLDGKKPEEYEVNILTLPAKLLEVLNDPDVMNLFQLQGTVTSSGSAMENTEDEEM
jgi:hypothetical protein